MTSGKRGEKWLLTHPHYQKWLNQKGAAAELRWRIWTRRVHQGSKVAGIFSPPLNLTAKDWLADLGFRARNKGEESVLNHSASRLAGQSWR
jgi:hypothetical protein